MDDTFLQFVRSGLAQLRPSQFVEVSEQTGIPLGTIRKIHYGEVDDPRVGTIQALHDYFSKQPQTAKAAA